VLNSVANVTTILNDAELVHLVSYYLSPSVDSRLLKGSLNIKVSSSFVVTFFFFFLSFNVFIVVVNVLFTVVLLILTLALR
jgi:hypothetical protein